VASIPISLPKPDDLAIEPGRPAEYAKKHWAGDRYASEAMDEQEPRLTNSQERCGAEVAILAVLATRIASLFMVHKASANVHHSAGNSDGGWSHTTGSPLSQSPGVNPQEISSFFTGKIGGEIHGCSISFYLMNDGS